MKNLRAVGLVLLGMLSLAACSSSSNDDEGQFGNAGNGGSSAGTANGGSTDSGGDGGQNQGGSNPSNGGNSGAGGLASEGGSGGGNQGGAAGETGEAGASGAGGTGGSPDDAGDTPPWRLLSVTAGADQITHGNAGLDPRAAKMMGKLVIDLGVTSGSYVPWLGKRGFHVMGISFPMCSIGNNLGRDHNGDCRLNTFDGMPHGDQNNVSPSESMSERIRANLESLHGMYSDEDWGYFLNEDGSVRWSDVAFTGMSHGSSTAARIGRAVRLYRAVSLSGPRDNGCGNGPATGDFDPNNPPWRLDCNEEQISSWLDETPATPPSRLFSLVGMNDGQYGDIMFAMERMGYPGAPVKWNVEGATLTGTTRFYADEGHLDFLKAANTPIRTEEVLNIAFGVPPENQNPGF